MRQFKWNFWTIRIRSCFNKEFHTYIISPSFSLVWIRAQLLWSPVDTANLKKLRKSSKFCDIAKIACFWFYQLFKSYKIIILTKYKIAKTQNCIKNHTNLRLRGGNLGIPIASSKLFPMRTAGEDPRLLVEICRPATPPNILQIQKQNQINEAAKKNIFLFLSATTSIGC